MLKLNKSLVLLTMPVLIIMSSANVMAGTFASFKGGFYIHYPEDWVQVPYLTADMFLSRPGAVQSVLNYEAVFAPKTSSPFFKSDFLILTLDSMEWFYDYQIDSVVDETNKSFDENIEHFRREEQPSDFRPHQPVYDKNKKLLSVVSDIFSGDRVVSKNLMVKQFYDKGVANFYFYSPDSLFKQNQTVFEGIVNSFSTENIQEAVPKEEGKVSDTINKNEPDYRQMMIPLGAALMILIILLIRLRKAKARKQSE